MLQVRGSSQTEIWLTVPYRCWGRSEPPGRLQEIGRSSTDKSRSTVQDVHPGRIQVAPDVFGPRFQILQISFIIAGHGRLGRRNQSSSLVSPTSLSRTSGRRDYEESIVSPPADVASPVPVDCCFVSRLVLQTMVAVKCREHAHQPRRPPDCEMLAISQPSRGCGPADCSLSRLVCSRERPIYGRR